MDGKGKDYKFEIYWRIDDQDASQSTVYSVPQRIISDVLYDFNGNTTWREIADLAIKEADAGVCILRICEYLFFLWRNLFKFPTIVLFVTQTPEITRILLQHNQSKVWTNYDINRIDMQIANGDFDENLFLVQPIVLITKTFEQKDNGSALHKMITTLNGISIYHSCSFTQIRMYFHLK